MKKQRAVPPARCARGLSLIHISLYARTGHQCGKGVRKAGLTGQHAPAPQGPGTGLRPCTHTIYFTRSPFTGRECSNRGFPPVISCCQRPALPGAEGEGPVLRGTFTGKAILDDGTTLQINNIISFAEHAVNNLSLIHILGTSFAAKMKALGCRTIGVKRRVGDKPEAVDELYGMEELDNLLPRADVVAMSLPGNPSTYHVLNRERIALLSPNAIVLNAGRGTAIDTDALSDARCV